MMIRKDREITTQEDFIQILELCKVCRIAMVDNGQPYIVPMNFGYDYKEKEIQLYFHCAKKGRKLDIMRTNSNVCFEMDCGHELIEGDIACEYGYAYASIIGNGIATIIEDKPDKIKALSSIMEHQTNKTGFTFDDNMVEHITVFKITSTDFTGKRKIKQG